MCPSSASLRAKGSWRGPNQPRCFLWGTADVPESFSRLAPGQRLSWQLELPLLPQRAACGKPGDGRGSG